MSDALRFLKKKKKNILKRDLKLQFLLKSKQTVFTLRHLGGLWEWPGKGQVLKKESMTTRWFKTGLMQIARKRRLTVSVYRIIKCLLVISQVQTETCCKRSWSSEDEI